MSDQATAEPPPKPAVMKPVLARGTLLTVDLDRLAGFVTEGLGMETVRIGDDRMAIRDNRTGLNGEPYWVLDVRKTDQIAVPQAMLNHWGITVDSAAKVDLAYERISAIKEKYGLTRLPQPREQHGSYSFYIADADSNWWEVEYRAPGQTYIDLMTAEGKSAEVRS